MAAKAASLGTRLTTRFTPLINYLKVKVPEKGGVIKKYAAVELVPPTPAEILKAPAEIQKIVAKAGNGGWKQVTLRDGLLNTLICIEISLWFFVGEIIGKRSLIGYQIEGAVNWDAHI